MVTFFINLEVLNFQFSNCPTYYMKFLNKRLTLTAEVCTPQYLDEFD